MPRPLGRANVIGEKEANIYRLRSTRWLSKEGYRTINILSDKSIQCPMMMIEQTFHDKVFLLAAHRRPFDICSIEG